MYKQRVYNIGGLLLNLGIAGIEILTQPLLSAALSSDSIHCPIWARSSGHLKWKTCLKEQSAGAGLARKSPTATALLMV